jgi:ATP-binding cassette subfamily C protein CydC
MPPVLSLQVAVVGVRAFGITRGVSRYIERLTAHRVALNGMTELRVRLYQRMASGTGAGAVALKRGDLLARVGADIDDVGDLVVRGIIPALVAGVVVLGSAGAVAAFLPAAGLAVLICLTAVGIGGPALTLRAARISELMASAARSNVSASAMNIIENASELRVSGQMNPAMASLKTHETALAKANDAAARPSALANALTEIGSGAALILTLLLSAAAYKAGTISATEVAVIVLMPLAAFEAVAALSPAAAQVYKSRAAASRIVALADAGHPDSQRSSRPTAGPNAAKAESEPEPAASGKTNPAARGDLIAHDLTAGWVAGHPVLTGVNLRLAPGSVMGLVGASGAGKTTLLASLAGLLEPLAGQALIGRTPLVALTSEERGRLVAFIPEDAHIFATTVLENLRVAEGSLTPAKAAGVLHRVGLGRWMASLPDGLDTMLGSGGNTISGGERRRLLLARALVSPAQFILLDEPGEHLDAADAVRLTGQLMRAARSSGRGLLIVSHQEASLAGADQIWRAKDGQIVAA